MQLHQFFNSSVYMDDERRAHAAHLERHARKAEAAMTMLFVVFVVVVIAGGLFA